VEVARGDFVTVVLPGDYGKPRPALVIQSDLFDAHPSVTFLPETNELRDAPLYRIAVTPSSTNGLHRPSQVRVDKPQTVARTKFGTTIGRLDNEAMLGVNRALAAFLGFA